METCGNPFVSIVIPAYNVEKTIEGCIRSIILQTYGQLEIIVVDDGSEDDTYHVVKALATNDKRIKIIRQENQGASAARNGGIREAVGRFILFVDADDMIMEDMVEILLQRQKEYQADLVQCAIIRIFNENHQQIFSDMIFRQYESRDEINSHFFDILNNDLNSPVGKLYKKKIIDKHGIFFDEQLEVSEDLCFNLQYLEKIESMVYIPDALYCYYLHNSFLTKKYKRNLFDIRKRAIEILEAFLNRNELNRNIIHYLYIKLLFASAMQEVEYNRNRQERYKEINDNLNRIEVRESLDKCKPEHGIEKILYYIIKSRNEKLIDMVACLLILIRKNRFLKIKRISV